MSGKNTDKSSLVTTVAAYVTVTLAFIFMAGVNIYAFKVILGAGESYSELQTAAVNLKFKVLSANILFKDIASGVSDKDMNEVWMLTKGAKIIASQLTDTESQTALEEKIDTFKTAMLNLFVAAKAGGQVTPASVAAMTTMKADYENAYKELVDKIDASEHKFKNRIAGQMDQYNNLYVAILSSSGLLFAITMVVISRYVKKCKRAELNFKHAREEIETVVNSMDAMLTAVDGAGAVIQWNNSMEKYFKIPAADALGQPLWKLLPFMNDYKSKVETVGYSGRLKDLHREKIVLEEGKERFLNIVLSCLSRDTHGVVIRIEDITELELRDEQLRFAQKMEVVRNLVNGLTHDFNNVIGAITGTISMMRFSLSQKAPLEDVIRSNIDLVESSAERAAVMVRQLHTLTDNIESETKYFDFNESIKHVLKICENTFDKKIKIIGKLHNFKVMIKGDQCQLEQMLLNLCDNASQAMTTMRGPDEQQGGIMILSIKKIFPDRMFRELHPQCVRDSYWVLSISDTGPGVDSVALPKIFDPFFTTKKGASGLGLTVVNDIVKKHNGFIEVLSEKGAGSKFIVYIPDIPMIQGMAQPETAAGAEQAGAAIIQETDPSAETMTDTADSAAPPETAGAGEPPAAAGEPRTPAPLPSLKFQGRHAEKTKVAEKYEEQIPLGSGLVLVADDEAVLRKTAKSILEKLGYEVILAENGGEAVDIFRENHKDIKAVVLDLGMPVKSGKEAFLEMKSISPDIRVLLASGFKREKDARITELLQLGVRSFIQKPYNLASMARELDKIIKS